MEIKELLEIKELVIKVEMTYSRMPWNAHIALFNCEFRFSTTTTLVAPTLLLGG